LRNVGSLLVRAAGRLREMSVRYAMEQNETGDSTTPVEGLLLGLTGGALGIILAPQILSLLIRMIWATPAWSCRSPRTLI